MGKGKSVSGLGEVEKSAILNAMSDIVTYQDTHHNLLWVNRAAARSVKSKQGDLPGRYCYEIWAGRKKPCEGCPVEKAGRTGKPQKAEMKTPDGRSWLVSGYPLKSGGKLKGIVEVAKDITDHKRAENKLEESEEKFRLIFENMPFVAFTLDRNGRLLEANKYTEKLTGLKMKEAMGKKFSDFGLLGKKDKLKAFMEFRKNLGGKVTGKTVYNLKLKNGEKRLVELIGIPLKRKGKVTKVLDIGEDVTERKKAEDALRKSKEKLEEKVADMEEFNKMTIGREKKMIELKERIRKLEEELKEKSG